MNRLILLLCVFIILSACANSPPKHINNICKILEEKPDWYPALINARNKWKVPVSVTMAIIHQESRFVADAQPPRPKLLGFIPWFRSSSAYGYPQAQNGTWDDYLSHPDSLWSADRDNFADACDFIGWYCSISHKKLGIAKTNTEQLYLAYHEGHTGYRRKTYLQKTWLRTTAKKVASLSKRYKLQFSQCENDFASKSWIFW